MRTPLLFAAIAVLCAAAPPAIDSVQETITAQQPRSDGLHLGSRNQPVKVDGVLYIDQRAGSGNNGGGCDGGVGICFTGKGTLAWDFLALTGQPATIHTRCSDSDAGAAPGCRLGDTILMGSSASPPVTHGTLFPFLSADEAFVVRACATGINDGGTFDMPSATFSVRCFR